MFIGHFAVGFAAKRLAPEASLGWLIAAPELVDMLWPGFLALGWEQVRIEPGNTAFTPLDFVSYPWTHSLVMSIVWAIVFGGIYYMRSDDRRGSLVIGGAVLSHWVLDVLTHRPDMPIAPGLATKIGLGLWDSVITTIVVESGMFVAGVLLYIDMTKARDRIGTFAMWGFIALLAIAYASNITGPPPPSVSAIEWVSLAMWLLPFWAAWFDRHREVLLVAPAPA